MSVRERLFSPLPGADVGKTSLSSLPFPRSGTSIPKAWDSCSQGLVLLFPKPGSPVPKAWDRCSRPSGRGRIIRPSRVWETVMDVQNVYIRPATAPLPGTAECSRAMTDKSLGQPSGVCFRKYKKRGKTEKSNRFLCIFVP